MSVACICVDHAQLPQFANDLIGYYLDFVVTELETSEASRSLLLSTNAAYRALSPPKPTYNQFVTDNGIAADWWRNRLRLLRLLGGSHETASQYDVEGIASRLEKHKEELVPETIVLCGRQGRHAEAIHLLTHGLGDFDTAISYCVLGGSSTYSLPTNRARYASMPSKEKQMELFRCLLEESFRIDDLNERISQTSELLERFSSWFDIEHVCIRHEPTKQKLMHTAGLVLGPKLMVCGQDIGIYRKLTTRIVDRTQRGSCWPCPYELCKFNSEQ